METTIDQNKLNELIRALEGARARLGCMQSYLIEKQFPDMYGDRHLNADCMNTIDNALIKFDFKTKAA